MASDAITKIVFLPVPVSRGFFPLKKVNFRLFFTVKQIFLKIKLWPIGIGTRKGKRSNHEKTRRTRSRPGHHRRRELGIGRSVPSGFGRRCVRYEIWRNLRAQHGGVQPGGSGGPVSGPDMEID